MRLWKFSGAASISQSFRWMTRVLHSDPTSRRISTLARWQASWRARPSAASVPLRMRPVKVSDKSAIATYKVRSVPAKAKAV